MNNIHTRTRKLKTRRQPQQATLILVHHAPTTHLQLRDAALEDPVAILTRALCQPAADQEGTLTLHPEAVHMEPAILHTEFKCKTQDPCLTS